MNTISRLAEQPIGDDNLTVTGCFCHPDRKAHLTRAEGEALWRRMRDNGYSPLPIAPGEKVPSVKMWPVKATEGAFAWDYRRPGVGLLLGGAVRLAPGDDGYTEEHPYRAIAVEGGLLALDLDLNKTAKTGGETTLSPEEQQQAREAIMATSTMRRVLNAGALLRERPGAANCVVAVRNDGAIAKKQAWTFERCGKQAVVVEVLAAGQQFLAFALHPSGSPYLWADGRSPETVPLTDLPAIGVADLGALHDEVTEALEPLGLVASEPRSCGARDDARVLGVVNARILGRREPPRVDEMRAMLEHLAGRDAFTDRARVVKDADGRIVKAGWLETGMALKAAYGDEVGFELWSITHNSEKARADAPGQWASFAAAARPGDVTVGTIIRAALHAGFEFAPCPTSADPTVANELEAAFARLAALSSVDYDRARKDEAVKLNIRVGTLDEEIERRRPKRDGDDEGKAGKALKLGEPDPWHEPVDGAVLLDELVVQIQRYVMLPREAAITVALWIVHCYGFELFPITPRLLIQSPAPRCGKTRLIEIMECLVPKALRADNISAASMFRVIEKSRPVVLVDEADSFLKDSEDHRNIINSGHARGGAVVRLVGDDFEPRAFSTFAPVALASIGSLADTIMDRGIVIAMRRRLSSEPVDRFRSDRAGHLHELARKVARFVADHEHALRNADPDSPEGLHDRACDNWRALLAIAELAGGEWARAARAAAQVLSAQGGEPDEQARGIMLLADIRRVFDDRTKKGAKDRDRVSSTELVADLVNLPDRPWVTWSKGKPITAARVARELKSFHITPNTIKLSDGKQPNGYTRGQFDDAFGRYLSPLPDTLFQSSPRSPTPHPPSKISRFQSSPFASRGELSNLAHPPQEYGNGEAGELQNRKYGGGTDSGRAEGSKSRRYRGVNARILSGLADDDLDKLGSYPLDDGDLKWPS
jgi:putative DNA primase/helicase